MKTCLNCKNQVICTFFQNINEEISKGLKYQVFPSKYQDHPHTSRKAILGGLARSCSSFSSHEYYDIKNLGDDFIKDLDKIKETILKEPDFLKEFISSNNEQRDTLLEDWLDTYVDDIKNIQRNHSIVDSEDDYLEVIFEYIKSLFGI